jgi:hypothetical protein
MFWTSLACLAAVALLAGSQSIQSQSASEQSGSSSSQSVRIEAEPASGFHWPYFLYVPPALVTEKATRRTILVLPNNTGRNSDDFAVHERSALINTITSVSIATVRCFW